MDKLKYYCIQPYGGSENRMICVISVSIGQIKKVLAQKKAGARRHLLFIWFQEIRNPE